MGERLRADALLGVYIALEQLDRAIAEAKREFSDAIKNEPWTREDFSKNTRTAVNGMPCAGAFEFGREAPNDAGVARDSAPFPAHMCFDVSADDPQ